LGCNYEKKIVFFRYLLAPITHSFAPSAARIYALFDSFAPLHPQDKGNGDGKKYKKQKRRELLQAKRLEAEGTEEKMKVETKENEEESSEGRVPVTEKAAVEPADQAETAAAYTAETAAAAAAQKAAKKAAEKAEKVAATAAAEKAAVEPPEGRAEPSSKRRKVPQTDGDGNGDGDRVHALTTKLLRAPPTNEEDRASRHAQRERNRLDCNTITLTL
jgi:hypothetical protein